MDKAVNENARSLLERILEDAREEAAGIAEKAREEVRAIEEAAAQKEKNLKAQLQLQNEKLYAAIVERSRTNAALESRKYSLLLKRELLDESFRLASERLYALRGEKREQLLSSLLFKEAEGGEQILANDEDRKLLEKLLPHLNQNLSKAGKKPLCLSEKTGKMAGGFLLLGEAYEKNCSFEALLALVRENEESRVADILFR